MAGVKGGILFRHKVEESRKRSHERNASLERLQCMSYERYNLRVKVEVRTQQNDSQLVCVTTAHFVKAAIRLVDWIQAALKTEKL